LTCSEALYIIWFVVVAAFFATWLSGRSIPISLSCRDVASTDTKERAMADRVRWGIMGTGRIARTFARGLAVLPDAGLVAVGSRRKASADTFGDEFDVPHRHASYEALVTDPHVDVVYVATPHAMHRDNMILCLEAAKPVLCEKPFSINAAEAEEVIALARERGLFLMEAMWTRFLPGIAALRDLLAADVIGAVRMLKVGMGFRAPFDPRHRLFDPALGGGALLDIGVYNASLASMIFGPPARVTSVAHLGESGVDEQEAVVLAYEQGQCAVLTSAIRVTDTNEAVLLGTGGQLRVHSPWWSPTRLTITKDGGEEAIEVPYTGNGYNYEATEVMRCLRAGQHESAVMPLDETLSIMRTLDEIRAQWGLRYPMEN
jgi:predicted dehydrogenase